MIKYIFFDNDGVLVDTEKYFFIATQEVLAGEGIELNKELFIELTLKKNLGGMFLFKERGYSEEEIEKFRIDRNNRYSQYLAKEELLIPGVESVIKSLYGKYKMGIVTSSKKTHFDIIHSRINLLKYFNFVLTIEDYPKSKPNPDPYLKALDISGLERDECVVVEDSERGLTAANSAGLRCIVIPNELTGSSDFTKAWKVLGNCTELLNIL